MLAAYSPNRGFNMGTTKKDKLDKISKEYDFYMQNKDVLQKDYDNKYIALKDFKVITSSDSRLKVIEFMLEHDYKLGEFLVQLVSDTSDAVYRVYSRVP